MTESSDRPALSSKRAKDRKQREIEEKPQKRRGDENYDVKADRQCLSGPEYEADAEVRQSRSKTALLNSERMEQHKHSGLPSEDDEAIVIPQKGRQEEID